MWITTGRRCSSERLLPTSLTSNERSGIERDLEIIERNAERLNREALDTLEYQRLP